MAKKQEDRNVRSGGPVVQPEPTDQELDADLALVREEADAMPVVSITEPIIASSVPTDKQLDEDLQALRSAERQARQIEQETAVPVESMVCLCCQKTWKRIGNRLAQPGCGCALHPVHKICGKCEAHCLCRRGV